MTASWPWCSAALRAWQYPPPSGKMPRMSQPNSPTRSGPRPLWLHQQTALGIYQSLRLCWPMVASAQYPWHPKLAKKAAALNRQRAKLSAHARAKLDQLLDAKIRDKLDNFHTNVTRYHAQPPSLRNTRAVLRDQIGSTRLWQYAPDQTQRPPILCVPSLVNRHYILDLYPGCSLLEYMYAQGFAPYIIDWDQPDSTEIALTLDDYTARALACADFVHAQTKQKIHVLGYCMGGVLAAGVALHRPKIAQSLCLLATPWDFAPMGISPARIEQLQRHIFPLFAKDGLVPVDLLQALFMEREPTVVIDKFSQLSPAQDWTHFTALEDWLNDGVPITRAVLDQCLIQWYAENRLAKGQFKILGKKLQPSRLRLPALSVIPKTDRIVPRPSAQALANALPQSTTILADTGHLGIVTSRRQQQILWPRIATWLRKTESL